MNDFDKIAPNKIKARAKANQWLSWEKNLWLIHYHDLIRQGEDMAKAADMAAVQAEAARRNEGVEPG